MKKIYLTAFALMFSLAGVMAQGIQVGPKVGLNFAKVSDGEDVSEGTKEPFATGLNLGVAFSIPVSEMFSIAPEISFSQKGMKLKEEDGDNFEKRVLNYVDVPVLLRASFGESVRGYVNVGPSFNYWMGGKVKWEEDGESGDAKIVFIDADEEEADDEAGFAKEYVNRFEIGAAIGGGVMFNTGAGDFMVDLRYTAGLSNFYDWQIPEYEIDIQTKNNVLALSVIYLFGSK